jgi:myo-inositol catabolism protein IolC
VTLVDPARVRERDAKISALGQRPPWWRPFARRAWKRAHAAIMAMDVSAFGALFRSHYTQRTAQQLRDRERPVLSALRKGPKL